MTVQLADAAAPAPPESLDDLITATADLAASLGAAEAGEAIAELRGRLADPAVRVVVLGGARTGRSTLRGQLAEAGLPADYELVEAPPIDGALDDLAASIAQTAESDIVVFAVSAHAALSRTEIEFLAGELLPHRLARVILVVTHLDQGDEPERVLRAVHREADALGAGLIVLPGPGRDPDVERLHAVRQAIADIDTATVRTERRHQVAVRLGAEIEALEGLAEASAARQADHTAGVWAVAEQETLWQGLREALQRQQRRLRERLHGQVDDERDTLVAALTRDLNAAPDPVAWWTTELPDRLGRLLLDVGRRLDETLTLRSADSGQWLDLELRSQLGIDDFTSGAGSAEKHLPVAAVTATRPPGRPDRAGHDLARDLLQALRPVLPAMINASRAFRGKTLVVVLVEPFLQIIEQHLTKLAAADHRAELVRQLPAVVERHLNAYQDAVAGGLAEHERAELERLDNRWNDWRSVQVAATGDDAPDAAAAAERARTLGRQVHLLQTTIKGSHR